MVSMEESSHQLSFVQLVNDVQPTNGVEFCQNYLNGSAAEMSKATSEPVPPWQVWGLGLVMITVISLSAACGILLFPLLSPSFYERTLTYFVAVGVGTLSGSALFNLIPEAFDLLEYMPDYLDRACMAIAGIYLFYVVDVLLNVIIGFKERGIVADSRTCEDGIAVECAEKVTVSNEVGQKFQTEGRKESLKSNHIHSHTATIAWLIIFGDGLHNFIDGLSIGCAFNTGFIEGITISVAVLCEEVPHELGDCAILIESGMSLRRALIYNLLSASTCFGGFAVGVLVGEVSKNFGQSIFALAGGMFLYISLAGMLSQMTEKVKKELKVNVSQALKTVGLQAAGLTSGLTLIYVFARYGSQIKF